MTVEELFSVQEDNHRLRSLYIELANHENFNPYKANEISDMPKGGGGKNFLEWYAEEKERIESDIEFYKKKIQRDRKMLDEYIDNAPYPERDIIRYKAINDLSWEEIGDFVGYSGRQTSRKFWEYIKKDVQNVQNVQSKI